MSFWIIESIGRHFDRGKRLKWVFCKRFWEVNNVKLKYKIKKLRDCRMRCEEDRKSPFSSDKDVPDTLIGVGGSDRGIVPSLY